MDAWKQTLYPVIDQLARIRALTPLDEVPDPGAGATVWPDALRMAQTGHIIERPTPRVDVEDERDQWDQGGEYPSPDKLAWYKSYHQRPVAQWGIYIRERPLVDYAWRLFDGLRFRGYDRLTVKDCKRLWLEKLLSHEYFHHMVDAAVVRVELETGQPLHQRRMDTYWALRRRQACVEEALANAFAFDRLSRSGRWREYPEALRALWAIMELQPPNYRDFPHYLDPAPWKAGLTELAQHAVGYGVESPDVFAAFFGHAVGRVSLGDVPVYLVDLVSAPPRNEVAVARDGSFSAEHVVPRVSPPNWPSALEPLTDEPTPIPSPTPEPPRKPSGVRGSRSVSRDQGRQFWMVNTCAKHTDQAFEEMLTLGKAAAYGDHMHLIDKIRPGDWVCLYHSGVGVIAWGEVVGDVAEGVSSFGWDERFVPVAWGFQAHPYRDRDRCVSAREINQGTRRCGFLGTAFRIHPEVAERIVQLAAARLGVGSSPLIP